ncbi:MAG: helix-turn-helix domain-containing protein, partial [Gammaproteobacteria bacterium]|nr:helix-turn-helix domain-containing protein [Gammaproteobacteria bacterium]
MHIAMNQQNSRILLANLARRVRQGRERRAWTRRDLALKSGLSLRFLADIESGRGNPSLRRLTDLAAALEIPVPTLLLPEPSPDGRHIALLGLRGAGKTTLGRSLARKLKRRFVELDARIEVAAGLSLSQIFEIHGETYFRRLEREALSGFVTEEVPAVLATGGGLVMEPETYRLLRAHCRTVWLRALPDDHYNRVLRQGDRRPMADNPQAMVELRSLLAVREPFYRRAELTVDTSTLSVVEATRQLTG